VKPAAAWPALACTCFLILPAHGTESFQGRSLVEVISALESRGLVIYYSSHLVRPDMIVREEPAPGESEALLNEILRPFDLTIEPGPRGSWLIVRRRSPDRQSAPPPARAGPSPGAAKARAGPRELDKIVVSASRYQFVESGVAAFRYLPVEDIQQLPDLGDDPLRAIARLPGTATGGFSAKSGVRGGGTDETLYLFDGLRLRNPYHLKDFQGLFSAIDPAIIDGMTVYTGAAPARYGNAMSAVVDIEPVHAPLVPYREVSQSFFNSSLSTAGSLDGGRVDWAAAARRGNLDLILDVVDPQLGNPRYVDLYGRLGVQVTDALRVTGNLLVLEDDIAVSDSDGEEQAHAEYRDAYFWVGFAQELPGGGSVRTLLSHTDLSSRRTGFADQSGVSRGRVLDERDFRIDTLRTDWTWWATQRLQLGAGLAASQADGRYDYADEAEFDLRFLVPGAPADESRQREIHVRPGGDEYGAYLSAHLGITERLAVDAGLRWDRETLSDDEAGVISPRLGILFGVQPRTTLRASWGRHFQSQGIDELQVMDGVARYFRPQRADHLVVSLEHRTAFGIDLRLEAYRKSMDRLRPRFENLLNTRVLLPELKPDRIRIAPRAAEARGIELTAAGQESDRLGWWLSYAWASAKDAFDDGEVDRSWDQRHALYAGIEWRGDAWAMSLAGAWRSGWPTTAVALEETDPATVTATGPRNGEQMGRYASIDARISRHWRWRGNEFSAFFEVVNVTGRGNECCVEYELEDEDESEDPTLDLTTLDYLGVFPSLGVTWRF